MTASRLTLPAALGLSAALFASLTTTTSAHAQECASLRMMVVLDKSSSMNGLLGDTAKWDVAADALSDVAAAYQDKIELGLNVFPAAGQCSTGEVLVAPAFGSHTAIANALSEPPPSAGS